MDDRKPAKSKDHMEGTPYEVLHILSDINRIQILRLLAERGELCARDILSNFPITQPTLSHHMNVLLTNHLVEARKSGRWVFYHLSQNGIQDIINFFEALKSTPLKSSAVLQKTISRSPGRLPGRNYSKKPSVPAAKTMTPAISAAVKSVPQEKPSEQISDKKEKKKDKDKDKLSKKEKKKKKNKKK
ncbi:MAG: metalloregulator ArsR/SmtB family transcription factor [Eubacteriales bacterium]